MPNPGSAHSGRALGWLALYVLIDRAGQHGQLRFSESKRVFTMSDFVKIQLEQLEPQLRAVVAEITRVQVVRFSAAPCWTPVLNVYRYPDRLVVCVDLAGVGEQALSVKAEPRRLRLAGYRPPPEPRLKQQGSVQVFTMEIDYGRFERELSLPDEIDPGRASAEKCDGWLWIHLPLRKVP
jgi:HSP20 family protein